MGGDGSRQKAVARSSSAGVKGWERRVLRWCAAGERVALSTRNKTFSFPPITTLKRKELTSEAPVEDALSESGALVVVAPFPLEDPRLDDADLLRVLDEGVDDDACLLLAVEGDCAQAPIAFDESGALVGGREGAEDVEGLGDVVGDQVGVDQRGDASPPSSRVEVIKTLDGPDEADGEGDLLGVCGWAESGGVGVEEEVEDDAVARQQPRVGRQEVEEELMQRGRGLGREHG